MIVREAISSTNVASAGYDEQSETLEVEFANGSVYQYFNVGLALYEQFRTASSKGQFLNSNIRNSYPYSRVA